LNNFNVFNQIGLIALNVIGEVVTITRQAESSLPSRSEQFSNQNTGLDPETAIQIKKLQQEKDNAVRNEDFDLAKEIKDTINRLMSIGTELTKLENEKQQAVANEDFDVAKQLKMQIDQLKASAFNPGVPQQPPQMPP